ncbi:hypothetical protein F2P81_013683 [Scophthalmus maximus]|uniref:Uncharacterized protein n=1 Tax=Scophthalmus maximus TaxID=52904 RepID=A0A6A4SK42_SCOMX|nr:hypothetical protein F2P81_013683 [Scophthalmus maximus]
MRTLESRFLLLYMIDAESVLFFCTAEKREDADATAEPIKADGGKKCQNYEKNAILPDCLLHRAAKSYKISQLEENKQEWLHPLVCRPAEVPLSKSLGESASEQLYRTAPSAEEDSERIVAYINRVNCFLCFSLCRRQILSGIGLISTLQSRFTAASLSTLRSHRIYHGRTEKQAKNTVGIGGQGHNVMRWELKKNKKITTESGTQSNTRHKVVLPTSSILHGNDMTPPYRTHILYSLQFASTVC